MAAWQFACSLTFLLLGLSLANRPLAAEDWTRFRGPQGSGVAADSVPENWSNTENLAWKMPLPGPGSSSPVVHGDRIFLTSYSGYGLDVQDPGDFSELRLHVLCLSLSDGKLLWDRTYEPSPEEQRMGKRVAEHGYATPTPCVDQENVYASFGPSGVVALTHQGERLWRQSVGTGTAGFGAAASPVAFQDLVIVNASIEDDAVYGLDKKTGEVRWRTGEINRSWTTPTIVELQDGTHELVINQKGAVLGLDPSTGEKLWSCEAIQDYIVPGIVADGEKLYCSGGRQNKTFAIRAGGRGDVSVSHLIWDARRGANVTMPLLDDGYLYWSHDKALALCLRVSDGKEMFRERLPTRSRVYASIVGDGDKLFLTTRDAGVVVLAAESGYRELSINKLGSEDERFNATPAIAGGRLLLRSDQALYCVSKRTST